MQKQYTFKSNYKLAAALISGVILLSMVFAIALTGSNVQKAHAAVAQSEYWDNLDTTDSLGYWSSTMSAPLKARYGTATDLSFAALRDDSPYGYTFMSPKGGYQIWYDVYGISLRIKIGGVWYVQDHYDVDTLISSTGYEASIVNMSLLFGFIIGEECEAYAYAIQKYSGVFYRSNIIKFTPTNLLATQESLVPSANITYHNIGSVPAAWPKTYTRLDSVTLPVPANKTDYAFAGWYTNSEFTGSPLITIPLGSGGHKDLYAKWVFMYDIVELPPDPVRTGYDFVGWFYDSAFTMPYDYLPIYSNTELYAKFDAIVYNITYNFNDGVMSGQPNNYTIESGEITLPTPTRTGYMFKGWYTSSSFSGDAVTSIPAGTTGHKTYYAKWEVLRYTVTFYVNGAVYKTMEVDYGTTLGKLGTDPALAQYSIQSVQYPEGFTPTGTDNFIVEGAAVMYLEVKTGVDAATGWFQSHWQTILWIASGALGVIVTASVIAFFVRRKKNYGR